MSFKLLALEVDIFFKSVLEREKKATSDPEIRAEHINRTIINRNLKVTHFFFYLWRNEI